jgi:8-oxo-dGTP pyrophosphatase MutT (NUDIX family)
MAAVAPAPIPIPTPAFAPYNPSSRNPSSLIPPAGTTKLPKPRAEMTEADWVEFDKTSFKSWYKNAGLIITKGDRVLVVQDKNTKKWSFPKGAPDAVDTHDPKKTAIRETYEEAGLIPEMDYRFDSIPSQRFPYDGLYYFAIATASAVPKVNDDEGCDVRWYTRTDLKTIWSNTNAHIKHFVNNYW